MSKRRPKIEQLISELCPEGMEFKPLRDVGTLIRGSGLQKKDFTESGVGCIHFGQLYTYYRLFADKTKAFVSSNLAKKLKKAKKGDVLIAGVSENIEDVCKPLGWLGDEICISGDMFAFRHNQNTKFITYLLLTIDFQKYKERHAQGAKVTRVKADKILDYKIPIPPLPIQEEIVKILDTFAELESELESRKKQYEYYRNELLTFEEDGDPPIRWVRLDEVINFMNGKGHEKHIDENGDYIVVNSKFISTDGLVKKYSKRQISPIFKDDILMVMSDLPNGKALAKCFIVDDNNRYTLNQRICALSVKDKNEIRPKFLHYILSRNRQLLRYDNGVDQTNLRKDDILKIRLPIPPLAEQERIVTILDKFDSLVNDISIGLPAELNARRKQYEYYRDRLLTFQPLGGEV